MTLYSSQMQVSISLKILKTSFSERGPLGSPLILSVLMCCLIVASDMLCVKSQSISLSIARCILNRCVFFKRLVLLKYYWLRSVLLCVSPAESPPCDPYDKLVAISIISIVQLWNAWRSSSSVILSALIRTSKVLMKSWSNSQYASRLQRESALRIASSIQILTSQQRRVSMNIGFETPAMNPSSPSRVFIAASGTNGLILLQMPSRGANIDAAANMKFYTCESDKFRELAKIIRLSESNASYKSIVFVPSKLTKRRRLTCDI